MDVEEDFFEIMSRKSLNTNKMYKDEILENKN